MDTEITPQRPVPLWRNRDYLLLWLGQAVSSLGTRFTQFAFPLLIVGLTHSIAAAGFAYGLEQLPYVLLSLPAGALVDRWPRKRVLLLCTFCLMMCVAGIPLALLLTSGQLRLLLLYAIAFGLGVFSLFYEVAELAALAWVVPKSQLTTAVAQNEFVYSSCSLLGPALGSLLFSISRLLPFVTDALSYLLLLCSLLNIRSPMQDERSIARRHLLVEVREGLTWLWSQKVLRLIVLLSSYLYFIITVSVLLVLAIVQQQHIPSVLYGLIVAGGGVGNLLAMDTSEHTITAYLSDVDQFVRWYTRHNDRFVLDEVPRTDIREYREVLQEGTPTLSPATINRRLASLRRFFVWAKETYGLSQMPTERIRNVQIQQQGPGIAGSQAVESVVACRRASQESCKPSLHDWKWCEFSSRQKVSESFLPFPVFLRAKRMD